MHLHLPQHPATTVAIITYNPGLQSPIPGYVSAKVLLTDPACKLIITHFYLPTPNDP